MKISAIICEFNPIHKGHKRLIDLARNTSDYVVCVMSGNFTQRGLPACADKYARARHAVRCGADLVVELPTVFACASAENFALGGVKIASMMGSETLLFGSECGDITTLRLTAELLQRPDTNERIREEIAKGASYPKAVALALGLPILDSPNNVLALEYIRAIQRLNVNIEPVTLKRTDNYTATHPKGRYASSTAIRANPEIIGKYSYPFVAEDMNLGAETAFKEYAPHALATFTAEELELIEGMTEGINNRIFAADKSGGYETLCEVVKTKRYTRAKIQRLIFAATVAMTKNEVATQMRTTPHTKVLAVSPRATTLLEHADNMTDVVTQRSDRLYYSFANGVTPPTKLQVVEQKLK